MSQAQRQQRREESPMLNEAAIKLTAVPVSQNRHQTADSPVDEAQPKSRLKRLWTTFKHGELKVVPMTAHNEEHTEHAQRWPTPAIAAIVLTAGGMLISTVLTISLALFTLYVNSNKDGTKQHDEDMKTISALQKDLALTQQGLVQAQKDQARIEGDVRENRNDIKVLKIALKLQ